MTRLKIGTRVISEDGERGVIGSRRDGDLKIPHGKTDYWVRWEQGFSTWTPRNAIRAA